MTLLQLQKRREKAMSALAAATTAPARKKATEELEAALLAIAQFKTKLDSKSVKTVKKEERYEETDEDEDEDEEASDDEDADDEPKKPAESDDDDDDDSDDDDDDDSDEDEDDEDESEDEDEDEEDEDEDEDERASASALASARQVLRSAKSSKNAKAISAARSHLKSVKRAIAPKSLESFRKLKAACQAATGKKSLTSILGALSAIPAQRNAEKANAAAIAKIKASQTRDKVDAMLSVARKERRVTKKELASLRADGIKMGTKWLKAHLAARPKLVRSVDDGAREGRDLEGGRDGDRETTRSEHLSKQNLTSEQRKMIEMQARDAGKSFDEFFADMNKTIDARASRTNGAS